MNHKALLSIGLPIRIRNTAGKRATVELNSGLFVVCRFRPNNTVYLNDANLKGWYPANFLTRIAYKLKRDTFSKPKTKSKT